ETLGVFRIAVPLEFQATGLSVAGFGVPVDLIEESISILRLHMKFNVNENHNVYDTERNLGIFPGQSSYFSGSTLSKSCVASSSFWCGVKADGFGVSC